MKAHIHIASRKSASIISALTLSLLCSVLQAQSDNTPPTHTMPVGKPIPDRYLVIFKSTVTDPESEADNIIRGHGGKIHHRYRHAIKGFSASIPAAALPGIQHNPNVESIEPDATVQLNQVVSPQYQPTWGIDRIDQRTLPLNAQYPFNYTGNGVTAFVIDTGIRSDHIDFGGRAFTTGYTAILDGNGTNDCNGHGTHVAGTIGGTTWGVAKNVKLVPVRVLDCAGSGSLSGVVAGIDWAAGTTNRPAVANLSLGSSKSTTVNAAVAGAYAKGISMVVAAGNSNADACQYSPSSEPTAITVGATTNSDARASYSNFGTCVDVFAPGSNITSAWYTGTTATNTISGTSMASPHVAGIVALALQANPLATPANIARFIIDNATLGKVTSAGTGSPNRLAFSLASGAPGVSQSVSIKNLAGSAKKSGKNWQALVTVTVYEPLTGAAVPNATVTGAFIPGGNATCVTGSTGTCSLASGSIAGTTTVSSLTVNTISGANLTYNATQNLVTQITVNKP